MSQERVVVTGIGVVCPVGIGKSQFWQAIVNGKSGAGQIGLSNLP
jgi:3-oxoacyl-[acyl-carrier-protein] synthase II